MQDKFDKENLVYMFMGPLRELAKTLGREFRLFRSQLQLLLFRPAFTIYELLPDAILIAVLRTCAPTLPSRLRTLAIFPSPYLY